MTLEIFVEPHILPSAWQNKKEPYRLEEQQRYFKLNKKSCSWWSCVYYIAAKVQRSWFKETNWDIWISKEDLSCFPSTQLYFTFLIEKCWKLKKSLPWIFITTKNTFKDPVLAIMHSMPLYLLCISQKGDLYCFPKAFGMISIDIMVIDNQCCT